MTPETLAELERLALEPEVENAHWVAVANPAVILELIARIRELEALIEPVAFCGVDTKSVAEQNTELRARVVRLKAREAEATKMLLSAYYCPWCESSGDCYEGCTRTAWLAKT